MDFWVTIATVLPILGLPLVLLARVHVAQLLDTPSIARVAAGLYALILVAIYLMEAAAVQELAASADVPGSEWLQVAAVQVVVFAGGALILSPGYLLLRIAFAGPGFGLKESFAVPEIRVRMWLSDRKTWIDRLDIWRLIRATHRKGATAAEEWFERWDAAVADGLLVYGPMSEDAEVRARFASLEDLHRSLVAELATIEVQIWRANYAFDRVMQASESNRERLQKLLRNARKANFLAVWQVFDGMTASGHNREGRASTLPATDAIR
jgi:hypothetical protein